MITIEKDFVKNESLESNWNELFNNSVETTIFQSYSFNKIVWDKLKGKGELYIILVSHNNTKKYLALFPCFIKKRCLRFINESDSDFCGPLFRRGYEHNYSLNEEIAGFFQSSKDFNRIVFSNMTPQTSILTSFRPFLKESVSYPMNYYSFFQIEQYETGISYIDRIDQIGNAKDRNRLKKLDNKVRDLHLEIIKKSESKEYPERIVSSLVRTMIQNGIRTNAYFNHQFLSVFKELYDNNLILIAVTWKGSDPVSLSLSLTNSKNEIIQWIALYKEKQYNIYNIMQLVKYLYETGGNVRFNFARGIYEYKLRNFRPVLKSLYCLRYSKSIYNQVKDVLACTVMQAKPLLKSIFRR